MLKKSKMSVQQRKYFVERITSTINKQILTLRQANAADVFDVSETHYNKYLKTLKVSKTLKEHAELRKKTDIAFAKLEAVYKEIKNTVVDPNADWRTTQDVPGMWSGSNEEEYHKAVRTQPRSELGITEIDEGAFLDKVADEIPVEIKHMEKKVKEMLGKDLFDECLGRIESKSRAQALNKIMEEMVQKGDIDDEVAN